MPRVLRELQRFRNVESQRRRRADEQGDGQQAGGRQQAGHAQIQLQRGLGQLF